MLDQVKRVFKDTAIYSLGSLLPKMAGIILAPIYTAYLTTTQYGIYSLAAMITSMVTVVMLLGQDGSLTLYYRQQSKGEEDHREMLFTVVMFTMGFCDDRACGAHAPRPDLHPVADQRRRVHVHPVRRDRPSDRVDDGAALDAAGRQPGPGPRQAPHACSSSASSRSTPGSRCCSWSCSGKLPTAR